MLVGMWPGCCQKVKLEVCMGGQGAARREKEDENENKIIEINILRLTLTI